MMEIKQVESKQKQRKILHKIRDASVSSSVNSRFRKISTVDSGHSTVDFPSHNKQAPNTKIRSFLRFQVRQYKSALSVLWVMGRYIKNKQSDQKIHCVHGFGLARALRVQAVLAASPESQTISVYSTSEISFNLHFQLQHQILRKQV